MFTTLDLTTDIVSCEVISPLSVDLPFLKVYHVSVSVSVHPSIPCLFSFVFSLLTAFSFLPSLLSTPTVRMGRINASISHLKPQGWFEMNFYRVHVIYFILTIILSSVIMYGSGVNGNSSDAEALFRLRYIDAIFLCTSAMTNTGLNTINLSDITGFQQSILCVLFLLGNVTIIANVSIWIRRYFFRKYMKEFLKHSKAAREMVDQIDSEESGKGASLTNGATHSDSTGIRRRPRGGGTHMPQARTSQNRKDHHEIGHGGLPYPWEWEMSRKFVSRFAAPAKSILERPCHHLSFQPSFDHKVRQSISASDQHLMGNRVVSTPSVTARPRSLVG